MAADINHLLLAILLLPLLDVQAFNVETNPVTVKIFAHRSAKNRTTTGKTKNPFFGYSIQGNRIKEGKKRFLSIMVGAPLENAMDFTTTETPDQIGGESVPAKLRSSGAVTYADATGVVYNCDMLATKFALKNDSEFGEVINCSNKETLKRSLSGFDIADHDTLGITLAADKSKSAKATGHMPKDRMVVCAHLRAHNCGGMHKAEGTCYVSNVVAGRGDGRYAVEWNQKTPCRQECSRKEIDLMFVIDGSESIGEERFETVKEWMINVAAGFDIREQVRIGVVQYSHWWRDKSDRNQKWLRTEIRLGEYNDQRSFAAAVRNITYHGFTTYTAHAIMKTVRDDFNGEGNRYPKARRVMILMTDGNSTDKETLPRATKYAENEGVTSFAVGVKGYVLGELLLIAGTQERVITVDDFNELMGIVSMIQFGIQIMEGSTQTNITNELMQCQAGISSELSALNEQ